MVFVFKVMCWFWVCRLYMAVASVLRIFAFNRVVGLMIRPLDITDMASAACVGRIQILKYKAFLCGRIWGFEDLERHITNPDMTFNRHVSYGMARVY